MRTLTPDEVGTPLERITADRYTIAEEAVEDDPIELLRGDGAPDMVWDAS